MAFLVPEQYLYKPEICGKNLTDIGFRVIGTYQNGGAINQQGLSARRPGVWQSAQSVYDHLRWRRRAITPWISVFYSWSAALRKADYFRSRGATTIIIMMLDLEVLNKCAKAVGANAVDAYVFAHRQNLPDPFYHQFELLYPDRIPPAAVVCYLPASQPSLRMHVHLATIKVPSDLLQDAQIFDARLENSRMVYHDAGTPVGNRLFKWILADIYQAKGVRDPEMALRVMQAMCVRTADETELDLG